MKIITLGNCCKRSKQNHSNVVIAAKSCGIADEVINKSDINDIMEYGVMSTPALVIDEQVVSAGRLLNVAEAEKLIRERM